MKRAASPPGLYQRTSLFAMPLFLPAILAFAPSLKLSDEVTALPGWNAPLPSKQYSGYLAVGEHKQLHYWLVEAENAPDSAPLVLWLNGGPGCSSLDGFIYEHGPFRTDPTDPTKLVRFAHTWVQHAHMLYLEAPAGVGFSYSTDAADYQTNDDQTASDSAEGMQAFFTAFPRYRKHAFFIAGESYAGVYVPTLAEAILSLVDRGTWEGAELKGIAVGNGCSGTEVGVCGGQRWVYDTTYLIGTALVDPQLKAQIVAQCDFTAAAPSTACAALIDQMSAAVGHVNLYNIYGECITGKEGEAAGAQQNKIPYARDFLGASRTRVGGPDACINSIAGSAYFNQVSGATARRLARRRPRHPRRHQLDLPTSTTSSTSSTSLSGPKPRASPHAAGRHRGCARQEAAIRVVDVRQPDPIHLDAQEPPARYLPRPRQAAARRHLQWRLGRVCSAH